MADTDSGGSTADGDAGADGSSQGGTTASSPAGSTASNPAGSIAGTLSGTLEGLNPTVDSGAIAGQQPSTGAESPTAEPGGTDTDENKDSDLVAVDPSPAKPVSTVVEPVANVVEPDPNVVAPAPSVVEPVLTVDPLVTNELPPVPGPATPVVNVVAPVPVLIAQATDVIAALEDTLTSVVSAVIPFAPLQPDLFSLLGIPRAGPVSDLAGRHDGPGLSTAAGASVLTPPMGSQMVLPPAGTPAMPSAGDETGVAPFAGFSTILTSQDSSLPAQERSALDGAIPMGVRVFFQRAFDELQRSPALAALTAAALPGVGGLLVVTAAGVRLGYRQAKAGLALQTARIARFARSGPIGVVRSGSLVVVRPRASHVRRPGTLGAGRLLDEVA